jgi:hypothetical protein
LRLQMCEQKSLLRHYFAATSREFASSQRNKESNAHKSVVLGGTQPSYKRIEERMIIEPGSFMVPARMPPNISVLRDMKYWTRAETDAWLQHLLEGQRGQLPPRSQFMWRLLPGGTRGVEKVIETVCFAASSASRLQWTPEELLYAEQNSLPSHGDLDPRLELPEAQTTHVYAPYSLDLFNGLCTAHDDIAAMRDLLSAIAKMEEVGPVHVRARSDAESAAINLPIVELDWVLR